MFMSSTDKIRVTKRSRNENNSISELGTENEWSVSNTIILNDINDIAS